MNVRALLLDPDLTLRVGNRELDRPAAGEVVIRVANAGICGSDLHVLATGDWVSYWPAVIGHEVTGTVEKSSDTSWPVGTRVVVDSRMPLLMRGAGPGAASGDGSAHGDAASAATSENGPDRPADAASWRPADRLHPDLAWLGEARPGGFEEAFTIPTVSLHRVPAGLPLDAAVLAEPLAVVLSALSQVAIDRTGSLRPRRVQVLGYGPIGYLAHAALQSLHPDAEVVVSEPNPSRSALAADAGATVIADVEGPEPDAFDLVVDAAGFPGSVAVGVDSVKRGGTVLLIAIAHAPAPLDAGAIVEKSVAIVGNNGFETGDLDRALELIAGNPARFTGVVSHRVALDDVPRFLASDERQSAMKILIECEAK